MQASLKRKKSVFYLCTNKSYKFPACLLWDWNPQCVRDVGMCGSCSAEDIQHSAGALDKSVKAGLDMISRGLGREKSFW